MTHTTMLSRNRIRPGAQRMLAPMLAALLLGTVACGQYEGGDAPSGPAGPATATAIAPPDPTVAMNSFGTTVYPIVSQFCGPECHVGGGAEGTPLIAHADLPTAYSAVVDTQKVSFTNPASSRLVRRLVADFHHCWTSCMADGAMMEAAIATWAADIAASGGSGTPVEGGLFSNELTFANGQEDLGSRRYDENLVALWEFKEGTGNVAADTSGVAPALDMTLQGEVEWMSSYGVDLLGGRVIADADASQKVWDAIAEPGVGTQQYSVEAWVIPDNVTQEGPARIVSYSRNSGNRNFTMGQVLYQYNYRNRSLEPEISDNGTPALETYDQDEDLQATLQHVVMTFDQFRGRRIYVNGRWTDDLDENPPGRLWNWEPGARLIFGDEISGDREWIGKIQLVAIYDHALTEAQIRQNYDAGVGKRLLLAFDISAWLGPGAKIEFSVREFDEFTYLFCTPTIVTPGGTGFRISNLRIMLNGAIPVQGQAFVKLDEVVTSSRQELSPTCSIIAKSPAGVAGDTFALAFEYLGNFEDPVPPFVVPPGGTPVFGDPMPGNGIRDFARVNETMAALTGVSAGNAAVASTFAEVTTQLPGDYDLRAFSASNQVGMAKLALEYCDRAVETPGIREDLAPGFDYDSDVATALDAAGRLALIEGMALKLLGQNLTEPLTSQPTVAEVTPGLQMMIDEMTSECPTDCGVDRTRAIAKGICTGLLGSSAATIH